MLARSDHANIWVVGGTAPAEIFWMQLDVSGTVFLPVPGDDDLRVDYDIKQKNKAKWNLVVGGN